jgi:hypothetical protein
MPDDEDKLLAAGIGKAGASGGRRGGALTGHSTGAAAGGFLGGWSAAWLLPKNVHEIDLTLATSPYDVVTRVVSVIGSIGRLESQTTTTDGKASVRGVIGAGVWNLNPAVVTVTISAAGNGGATVHIRGAAKEGLIKQRAGQKAAERLASMLN